MDLIEVNSVPSQSLDARVGSSRIEFRFSLSFTHPRLGLGASTPG
jgi:hypothetical protein